MKTTTRSRPLVAFLGLLLVACGGEPAPARSGAAPAPTITNRIPLPPDVIANLGITFEKARRGRLETRLAVPGRVEIAPEARFTVRAPAAGRVVMKTARWQRVAPGAVVAELLSPELRSSQEGLAEAHAAVERTDIDILRAHAEAEPTLALAEATVAALASARERALSAETGLATAREFERAALARVEATRRLAEEKGLPDSTLFTSRKDYVEAQAAALQAAGRRDDAKAHVPESALKASLARWKAAATGREIAILERRKATLEVAFRQQLRALSVLTGVTIEELAKESAGAPAWLALESIAIRAPSAGVVVEIPVGDGEWVDGSATLVRISDPTKVVFRGEVPEGDAVRIPANATVRIDVGCATCKSVETTISAPLSIAEPRTRTVLVEARIPGDGSAYPDGASAIGSVLLDRSDSEEVLVSAASVVQDELDTILFRRDPAKPDQVIRTSVSVGRRSEGWVEILSEVSEGDEIVHDGVHQLRLTGIGKPSANGHFHSDGTWHEGKD